MANREPSWRSALAAVDAGDCEALERLLASSPALAHARAPGKEPPYEGYFHGATLLHHTAGNPYRERSMPENVTDVTRLLLDAGAAVDAPCGGGPVQPNSGSATALGLLVSGRQVLERGHTEALFDLLVERGAAIDATGSGSLMWGALYHVVESPRQREAAALLLRQGHQVDMCFAACFGDLEVVREFWNGGTPRPLADRYMQHHRPGRTTTTPADLLQDVLLAAAVNGELEVARWALAEGADINGLRFWGPAEVTPLHAAAWAGWSEMALWLLEEGADRAKKDPVHASPPAGWARHAGHEALAALLGP